jgi:hypothetical protein
MVLADLDGQRYTVQIPTAEEFMEAARHVLWVLDGPSPEAQEPGTFTTELIRAMCHADPDNISRLARVYPALASHVHMYKTNPEGLAAMRHIATLIES